ncbi:MAG: DUF4835 family protein [Muribaculaceae bacterium]|nr:DUF4835 family protein [Muribaculaceae bacterium]
MKRLCFLLYLFTVLSMPSVGQELNCSVTINSDQVSGTGKQVFETLQQAINDYMNTTVFTNAQFATNEKIECRLFFTIKDYSDDNFSGDLQVQSLRPVYNSTYTTTLINFKDSKIDFTYRENEPLVFSANNMESQLTAILNFYAYLIIAVDFDSFSRQGGDVYFDRLAQIVQMAQSSGESGWKAFEDNKNRSAVLNSFTDPQTAGIREMIYMYHRQGLDNMSVSVDKGRAVVTQTLDTIVKIHQSSPMSVALSLFRDAKLDELVNIYSKAPAEERTKVYNMLEPVYPTEQTRLDDIKKGAEQR